MEKKINKKSRIMCLATIIILVLGSFLSSGVNVYASEIDKAEYDKLEQKLIEQYSDDLEFIYEKAAITNSSGEIEQIDLSILRYKYGNNEFFDYLQNNYGESTLTLRRGNFGECMKSEFQKIIGLDLAKQVFSPQVKQLLAKKAWKKASEIIVRTLGQKVGRKALGMLIKKMVPGGIPAQIVFSAGKCGIKVIW
ncbi:hypothetical protein [Lactococcus petauri]|jgi:hypothetical protein|uniref:hypothetical protein n=1 Tax=Lactococcus petauri TaxID=1940789 RepID=UPI00254D28FA|nr:hypothetical protein [Lactococcus petauri]